MASEQIEAGRDDQLQTPVGLSQGLLDRLRGFTAGKNEPGVTGALGKGLEFLVRFGGDHNIFDTGNAERRVQARHVFKKTGAGNG